MSRRRVLAAVSATVLGTLGLSACGFSGLYNIPLPGGASLGSHPYTITANFADALDLVPQSAVRVNEVPVGRVSTITISPDGRTARVKLEINGSVSLPANAVADVEQTSLLGEKYVSLAAPTGVAATGTLVNGAVITQDRTAAGIQVEQVFGALSLLLNGGGLGQLQSINYELNQAQSGRTDQFRSLFTSLDAVVGQLNVHRSDITTALDQLNALSANLKTNNTKITNVLANFSPGIAVLAQERPQLTAMLTALNRLSTVSVSTINASKTEFVSDLKLLSPILDQLAAAGQALPDSLQVLFTYPFPDAALGAIKGDYINGFITLNLNTTSAALRPPVLQPGLTASALPASRAARSTSSAPPSLLPSTSSFIPGAPSVLSTITSASSSGSPSSTSSPSSSAASSSSSAPATTPPPAVPTAPASTTKGGR